MKITKIGGQKNITIAKIACHLNSKWQFVFTKIFLSLRPYKSHNKMNKFLPLAVIVMLGVVTFTIVSCSKSHTDPVGVYTCTCSYSSPLTGIVVDQPQFTTVSEPESSATSQCNSQAVTLTKNLATVVTCHL